MGFFKELKEDLYQAIRELTSDDNDTDKPQEKHIDRTVKDNVAHEEIAVIASDIIITGNIKSDSSVEITGIVRGNIECRNKLVVTGMITGNTYSSDFYANRAQIKGDVSCTGPAKIGIGSVITGNLTAKAVVVAGVVEGDIFADGPVILDSTAIIRGDIRAGLIRVIKGAVIEGRCIQNNETLTGGK